LALSFVTSYTFSPSTTISSSQVNTNFSDIAGVFQGLEAKTKSFSNLKVDATPASATEVVIKSYVDSFMTWRRPVLQFGSVTTVAVESGLDGTSGNIPMLFPDGSYRTETSTTRTTFDITRNAVLITSGAQSGLTGATSEATNTWYALYACKVTDSTTLWVTVGSTVLPIRANYATLNTAYGTNGWVYLGMIRNGDNVSATGDILDFVQAGNRTFFRNVTGTLAAGTTGNGNRVGTGTGTSLTHTTVFGTAASNTPNTCTILIWQAHSAATNAAVTITDSAGAIQFNRQNDGNSGKVVYIETASSLGLKINLGSSVGADIMQSGFVDGTLGVGSNPLL